MRAVSPVVSDSMSTHPAPCDWPVVIVIVALRSQGALVAQGTSCPSATPAILSTLTHALAGFVRHDSIPLPAFEIVTCVEPSGTLVRLTCSWGAPSKYDATPSGCGAVVSTCVGCGDGMSMLAYQFVVVKLARSSGPLQRGSLRSGSEIGSGGHNCVPFTDGGRAAQPKTISWYG